MLLETGGGLDIAAVDPRVRRIVDVKCPGSGEAEANRWENLLILTARDEVKFVLAGEADYLWARQVTQRHRLTERCPVHFSPVHGELDAADLAGAVARFGAAAQQAIEDAARELQELRRQAASSIVIPETGSAALKGVGGKGGIQLP